MENNCFLKIIKCFFLLSKTSCMHTIYWSDDSYVRFLLLSISMGQAQICSWFVSIQYDDTSSCFCFFSRHAYHCNEWIRTCCTCIFHCLLELNSTWLVCALCIYLLCVCTQCCVYCLPLSVFVMLAWPAL